MFGAGGGTSSYQEVEQADVILLWGSNAREAHPIFFHHVLKALANGARMYAIDPRRTSSAKFADRWLGLSVGTDIALANAMGREIIAAGLHDPDFIAHSTEGFEAYAAHVESYTLDWAAEQTGVPAEAIRDMAHAYATAPKAQILWTLGITEHHNAVDNVVSLCNLALLTGHVGRWGSGLCPLRGQNNVQGGGDMGAIPNKFPGFQDVADDEVRAKFEAAYGTELNGVPGKHLTLMFEAMEAGELRACYVIGENPADSEADVKHARKLLAGLDMLVVQDIFMTRTAEMADVVLPASVAWAESEGTVTSSERRVQRVRPAVPPPGQARHDIDIIGEMARRLGVDWGHPSAQELWDEMRSLSPMHTGMSWERLEASGGLQWPCGSEERPGLGVPPRLAVGRRPRRATIRRRSASPTTPRPRRSSARSSRCGSPPAGRSTPTTPGCSRAGMPRPSAMAMPSMSTRPTRPHSGCQRRGTGSGQLAAGLGGDGCSPAARHPCTGLTFTTFHFPELVDANVLTNDEWDPRSGTAEFKAAAIRISKLEPEHAPA